MCHGIISEESHICTEFSNFRIVINSFIELNASEAEWNCVLLHVSQGHIIHSRSPTLRQRRIHSHNATWTTQQPTHTIIRTYAISFGNLIGMPWKLSAQSEHRFHISPVRPIHSSRARIECVTRTHCTNPNTVWTAGCLNVSRSHRSSWNKDLEMDKEMCLCCAPCTISK